MCELCEAGRTIQGIYKEKPDPFSEIEIQGDKLCVDLSGCDHEHGEFLIKYCPMCGRKLSNEIDWDNLTPQERNAYLGIFS